MRKGYKFSAESRLKISRALKGKPKSASHKQSLSDAHKGKPNLYWKGKKRSPEDVLKFRLSHLGKKHTEEQKRKISASTSGRRNYQWGKGKKDTRTWRKYAPRACPLNCESCGINAFELTKGLFVDHNHQTGEFRGWICTRCNVALGMVRDDTDKLLLLIKYLEKYGGNSGQL